MYVSASGGKREAERESIVSADFSFLGDLQFAEAILSRSSSSSSTSVVVVEL